MEVQNGGIGFDKSEKLVENSSEDFQCKGKSQQR